MATFEVAHIRGRPVATFRLTVGAIPGRADGRASSAKTCSPSTNRQPLPVAPSGQQDDGLALDDPTRNTIRQADRALQIRKIWEAWRRRHLTDSP